jgi:low affinity Fe/Cu permease
LKAWFRQFARTTSDALGSAWAFFAATLAIIVWGATGPIFHFSDLWQLIANTVTNVVTFLMVFLIQSSQSRDTKATQLKLDELIRAVEGARTGLVNLEALTDDDLDQLQREFERIRRRADRNGETATSPGGPNEAAARPPVDKTAG